MPSVRLKNIASFLEVTDKVVDIGCDHGYLGIYALQNRLVQSIILTDIKETALNMARQNIQKSKLNIPLLQSDGLENVSPDDINTIVISGMGTSTILHILNNPVKMTNVTKLILQSNNHLDVLRKEVTNLGFSLVDERCLKENDIWYTICLFKKGKQKLSSKIIKYGLLKDDKKDYYNYLITNKLEILKQIANTDNPILQQNLTQEIKELNELLEESRTIL